MNFLFLNQYGPGDVSPTAKLLEDMVASLRADGHSAQVISVANDYLRRVHGWRRWLRELGGLLRMLGRAWRTQPKPDTVVSFTSPPGLVILGAVIAWRHRARAVHWALDLYPDLALALGELRSKRLTALMTRLTRWAYDRADTVVTLDEDMRDRLRWWGVEAEIIPPWPLMREPQTVDAAPVAPPFWLYSGNLGRAHEWEVLLRIQMEIEKRDPEIELVFQGGGASWRAARAWCMQRGMNRVRWREYAEESKLLRGLLEASLYVVTQRPEVRGMLWPSKLALLLQLPRPILWIGSVPSSPAQQVSAHPGSAAFTPEAIVPAAEWIIETIRRTQKSGSIPTSFSYQPQIAAGVAAWKQILVIE